MRTANALLLALLLAGADVVADAAPPSGPHSMTAGELLDFCTSSDQVSKTLCSAYILGLSQGVSVGMAIADGKTQAGRPCIPDDASEAALELLVRAQMGQDFAVFPADKNEDAAGFVVGIFIRMFKCTKGQQ